MTAVKDLSSEKAEMRARATEVRARASERSADAGNRFARQFMATYRLPPGTAVSAFWPKGSELDLRPLLHRLHESGQRCLLPVVVGRGQPLAFRRWQPETILVEGNFRVMIPGPECEAGTPAFLLVPLLAFDRRGFRLGYGGGFYDRTLATLRERGPITAVGAAYSDQEVAAVPRDETDQPLDGLLTENGPIPLEDA